MSRAEAAAQLGALEAIITRYMLRGRVAWAREFAQDYARVRDGMLTAAEFEAVILARRA